MSEDEVKKIDVEKLSDQQRPSLVINAVSNWVVLGMNIIIGFLLIPYIIRHIGKGGYGIWTLVASVVGYFGLLQMGVGSAVMRYVPLYDGRNEPQRANGTFSSAMAIYGVAGLIILVISLALANTLSRFFNQGWQFTVLVRLVGAAAAIACLTAVLDATIRSRERFVMANIVTLFTSVIRGVALLGALSLGYGLIGMAYVTVGISAFGLFLNTIVFKRICPDLKFSPKMVNAPHLRELFTFGIMAMLTSIGFMLRFQSDRIIIGKFMNMEVLGIYAVVATLMLYYRKAISASSRVLRPRFGYLDGQNERKESVRILFKSTRFVAVIAGTISLLLMTIGPAFIKLWVGEGFEAAFPVLAVLAVSYLADFSQSPCVSLLSGYGKMGTLAILFISEGIACIIMSLIFVQIYGLIGVAFALALPMVLTQGIIRTSYTCNFLNIKIWEYYKACLLKPWGLVVLLSLPLRWVPIEEHIGTWLHLVGSATAIALSYLLLSYALVFSREEQQVLAGKFIRAFRLKPFATKRFVKG